VINDYLGYLADRGYSPRTVRAYAFDLLAFARWLLEAGLGVNEVTTEALLRFLAFCRAAPAPGRAGGNVYSIRDGRNACNSAGSSRTTASRRFASDFSNVSPLADHLYLMALRHVRLTLWGDEAAICNVAAATTLSIRDAAVRAPCLRTGAVTISEAHGRRAPPTRRPRTAATPTSP
jgi:hypothetical protein